MKLMMNNQLFKNPVDQCIILMSLALLFSSFALIGSYKSDTSKPDKIITMRMEHIAPKPQQYSYPKYSPQVAYYNNWYKPQHLVHETVTRTEMEYTYLGYYYLTAYSPQETGSWMTASGTTLHRADYENRLTEPTTCAIDRNLHSFGDLFYIPDFDRIFVAEDTGGAVRGQHLDLGYTDLESVWSFPTGWYEVYSVEYVYYEEEVEYYDFAKVPGIQRYIYLDHIHTIQGG